MKKFFAMLLCAAMLVFACASAETVANPWEDLTRDEAILRSGIELNEPEGAENVQYSYCESLGMLQMKFTLDGAEYTARAASSDVTDSIEDISGMNYEWENVENDDIDDRTYQLMFAHDGDNEVQVCNWLDVVPGIVYSISTVQPDTDGLDLVGLAMQVYVPMQGEC